MKKSKNLKTGNAVGAEEAATKWTQIPGGLVNVSVGNDGAVYGVNSGGTIYMYNDAENSWTVVQGQLKQISVGNAGNVWGVNSADNIYQYQGNNKWNKISGQLSNVSVASDGTVWGVNSAGKIFQYDGDGTWTNIAGALVQVSVGSASNVYGVNSGGNIYRYLGNSQWHQIAGSLKWISAGADGTVWGVNSANNIYRLNEDDTWTKIDGGLSQISVGNGTQVWGVNSNDNIYQLTTTENMLDITKDTMTEEDLATYKALYPSNEHIQQLTLDGVISNTPGVNGDWNDAIPSVDVKRESHMQTLAVGLSDCQMAIGYVIFDALCLGLGAVGLRSSVRPATIEAIARAAEPVASKIEIIIARIAAEGASTATKAKGVFDILKTIYSGGMLGAVFSAFTSSLSWWDAALYGITGIATIVAAFATDGLAFAAEVAILLATFGFLASDSVKAVNACS